MSSSLQKYHPLLNGSANMLEFCPIYIYKNINDQYKYVCQRTGNPNNSGFCLVLCIQVCNEDSSGFNLDQGILMTPVRDDKISSENQGYERN